MAGLAGVLFANCGAFVSPTIFSLPSVGADHHLGDRRRARHADRADHRRILMQWLTTYSARWASLRISWVDPNLVLGVLLVIFVLAGAQGPDGAA